MSVAYLVRQSQQQSPEWITLQQLGGQGGYEMQRIPLTNARNSYRQRSRVRIVSNKAFFRSLAHDMFQRPMTFPAQFNGQQATVVTTPIPAARVVHIQVADAVGIVSLGETDQEPTGAGLVGVDDAIAIMAIITIVAIVAVTTTGIVVIKASNDDASGEAEVETRGDTKDG